MNNPKDAAMMKAMEGKPEKPNLSNDAALTAYTKRIAEAKTQTVLSEISAEANGDKTLNAAQRKVIGNLLVDRDIELTTETIE